MNRQTVPDFVRLILICWLGAASTCLALPEPRLRFSDFFGAPGGVDYLNPDDLGQHCYRRCKKEKLGMVYTSKGGFLDIGHVREGADRTRYLIEMVYQNLLQSSTSFQFDVIEPSQYEVVVTYPDDWEDRSESEQAEIAREVSIQYGQYLGHQTLIWHELLTWFGYASTGLFPEHISSFSWEDTFSDVIGTCLAVEAIRSGGDYDEEMTRLLSEKVAQLQGEPSEVGEEAEDLIKNKWYTGGEYFFVNMKKRNFDVGYEDGTVTPWLVPDLFSEAEPLPCPVPTADCLSEYGFNMTVQLDPKAWEKYKIYKALGLDVWNDKMQLDVHFPQLLDYIKQQAKEKHGQDVDKPTL
ncbi:MAG: DUF4056 domain-containing protein [Planctomycetota bacterium]